MNDGNTIISYSFLAAALGVALLVLLCQEVVNRDMYKDSIQRFNTNLRLQELSGLIKLYDESLSMSSKMAVTTGDPQWEQRYRRFEPPLAAAIDEARELTWGTRADRGIAGTSVANGQLVDMEHSAFSLANRGDAQGARAILFSDEYRMQKRLYLAGLETLSTELPNRSGGSYDYPAKSIFAIVIALMALLGLTTVGLMRSNSQPTKRERNQDPENDFLKSVADDFSVMTVFYDQYGKVDSVNREFTSYLGYTAKEARQPNFRIRVCPDQGDFERLTRFVSAEEAGLLELPLKTKAGDLSHTAWIKVPLSGGTQIAIGFNNERQYLHSQQLKRLSVAVEQSSTSIVITDSDGKIEYVNPKFSELTGYGFQEAVGQNPRILKGGAVDQSVYEDLWGRISSGRPWRGEFLNKKKDGSAFWEMASISPLKDEQGRITHYVGIKEDITELKRIENTLKCANDELEQRVKERTSELAGVNLSLRAEIRKHELTERQLEGERTSLEAMLAQKTLLAEVASRLNSTDPFSENLGAVIEKTGRRMKLDHVCVLNLNNMESIELTRLSSWSSSGESHSEFCGFWHDCERKNNLKNVLRQNSPYFWCAASEKNNGAEIASTHNIGATVCCPLTVGGEIKGLIAFARVNQMEWEEEDLRLFRAIADMVVNSWERERQMRARIEAEQKQVETVQLMESSSRLASIGVMAAGITHEINQPLNTIKLTADGAALWMERNSASIPAKIVERIAKVSSQVDRINKIIRHMKEFWVSPSSSQSGDFELNEALERSLALVVHQAESHGVLLEKSLSSRSLLVEGNIIHLEQIVVNLSMNALQAFDGVSHGDKRIKVVSRTVDMSAVIEVSDNAKGLPAGEEANIFDPFYSTRKTGQGMGLGLAIVDRFVKDLGGSITAENNSDGGASFTVTLPLQSNNGL